MRRISITGGTLNEWAARDVLCAAADMRLVDTMPDDTARVYAAREPLALPWGDSCYTTAVYAQVDGWPRMVWGMGPVTEQTASSEGPRGRARGDAYMIRRLGRRRG